MKGQRCFHDTWNFDLYIAAPDHFLTELLTGSEADSSVHLFLLLQLVEDEDTAVLFIFGQLKLLLKLIRTFLIIINIS